MSHYRIPALTAEIFSTLMTIVMVPRAPDKESPSNSGLNVGSLFLTIVMVSRASEKESPLHNHRDDV